MGKIDVIVGKPRIAEVPVIHSLVNEYAASGEMLGRSLSELYEGMRDFFVAKSADRIVGCVALHINWEDLAEVRSLAVSSDFHGKGVGTALVSACLREAGELGIGRVYALTYRAGFFQRQGFKMISKETLPHKIWSDCLKCPRFPNCDEEALVLELT